jgi:hypothetical protein
MGNRTNKREERKKTTDDCYDERFTMNEEDDRKQTTDDCSTNFTKNKLCYQWQISPS